MSLNGQQSAWICDLAILSKCYVPVETDMHNYVHNDKLQLSSVECFSIHVKLCVSDSFIDHRALKIIVCVNCSQCIMYSIQWKKRIDLLFGVSLNSDKGV